MENSTRHRNKILAGAGLVLCALMIWSCASTFVVTKDGKSYFFGSKSEAVYKLLCESGDLRRILDDTGLPAETREKLYRYNCVPAEASTEKIREIYASLRPEQRRELRLSFQKHGYDINYMEC